MDFGSLQQRFLPKGRGRKPSPEQRGKQKLQYQKWKKYGVTKAGAKPANRKAPAVQESSRRLPVPPPAGGDRAGFEVRRESLSGIFSPADKDGRPFPTKT
jgi:hypothetical protein